MKKLLPLCALILFIFQVHSSPLAFIVLNTASWDVGHIPPDWQVKSNHGKPEISVCSENEGAGACLHLRSVKSSFALEHGVDVDPGQMPYLYWRWKVTQLPQGGDFRKTATDDQAAQVLVAFDDHRILSYIWDTSAPKGADMKTTFVPLIHVFALVCESGATDLNRWVSETRNVAEDYQRAFGKPAPRVKGLRLQINSQHTGTIAESYFGQVAFRSTPQ